MQCFAPRIGLLRDSEYHADAMRASAHTSSGKSSAGDGSKCSVHDPSFRGAVRGARFLSFVNALTERIAGTSFLERWRQRAA